MAKKTAPKKKVNSSKAAAKSKVAKKPTGKPAAKPVVKAMKPAAKAVKAAPAQKLAKKAGTAKPALMTKKGKEIEDENEVKPAVKTQSVVSMIESDASLDDPAKAEKVSKVKPVKIERGNLADEKAKWTELFKKYGKEKAINYKMSEKFNSMIPMQHKILGWGFVLTNENDRLEVLFETGIRMLISNYKS
jgi:hypothetical protein